MTERYTGSGVEARSQANILNCAYEAISDNLSVVTELGKALKKQVLFVIDLTAREHGLSVEGDKEPEV